MEDRGILTHEEAVGAAARISEALNNQVKCANQIAYDNLSEHRRILNELSELYARKNHDYGDSFHVTYEKWGLPMSAIRLGDKFSRFETLIRAESKVKTESIRDTLMDLANYSIMTIMELDRHAG